ncbi:phosphotransferase [Variovorax paradoxus]|uniref:phosphotransferase n=1 Tax=Variovorax paradoxus TaxID=34073 RepID=UPI002781C87A|nr:phosphotransferase [Variovorax paradoxus]MDQ0588057.1 Ser/Thr protein kinase RdoA (MazF antagonist) [Variovorax paradoxus]
MTDIDKDWLSSKYARSFAALELVVGGVNRTYRVREAASTFYLRLYRRSGRPLPQIAAEICLLTEFKGCADVAVGRPVAAKDGAYVLEVAWGGESRLACLFESVEGDNFDLTRAGMAQFGAALARLHLAMPTIIGGEVRSLDPVAIVQDSLQALHRIRQSKDVARDIEHHYLATLHQPELRALPSGLCHGDAWTGNARVHRGRAGFFDFDDFGRGPLVIDLGTAAWHLADESGPASDGLITALVDGYEKFRPLSAIEKDALPLFIQFAEIRSLLFLARYCVLTDEMWVYTFQRAGRMFGRLRNF